MIGELTASAVTGAIAAAGVYFLMGAVGIPVSGWWCATCAAGLFLVELYHA
jgi:hypothetical protein